MFCEKCGNKINDNQKFCSKCGYQVKLINAQSQPPDESAHNVENINPTVAPDSENTVRNKEIIIDIPCTNAEPVSEPVYNNVPYQQNTPEYEVVPEEKPVKKKKSAGKIIGIIVAVIIVLLIAATGVFAAVLLSNPLVNLTLATYNMINSGDVYELNAEINGKNNDESFSYDDISGKIQLDIDNSTVKLDDFNISDGEGKLTLDIQASLKENYPDIKLACISGVDESKFTYVIDGENFYYALNNNSINYYDTEKSELSLDESIDATILTDIISATISGDLFTDTQSAVDAICDDIEDMDNNDELDKMLSDIRSETVVQNFKECNKQFVKNLLDIEWLTQYLGYVKVDNNTLKFEDIDVEKLLKQFFSIYSPVTKNIELDGDSLDEYTDVFVDEFSEYISIKDLTLEIKMHKNIIESVSVSFELADNADNNLTFDCSISLAESETKILEFNQDKLNEAMDIYEIASENREKIYNELHEYFYDDNFFYFNYYLNPDEYTFYYNDKSQSASDFETYDEFYDACFDSMFEYQLYYFYIYDKNSYEDYFEYYYDETYESYLNSNLYSILYDAFYNDEFFTYCYYCYGEDYSSFDSLYDTYFNYYYSDIVTYFMNYTDYYDSFYDYFIAN